MQQFCGLRKLTGDIAKHNIIQFPSKNETFSQCWLLIKPLTTGPDNSHFFSILLAYKIEHFNMLNIQPDINQQDCKIVDLYFVKTE